MLGVCLGLLAGAGEALCWVLSVRRVRGPQSSLLLGRLGWRSRLLEAVRENVDLVLHLCFEVAQRKRLCKTLHHQTWLLTLWGNCLLPVLAPISRPLKRPSASTSALVAQCYACDTSIPSLDEEHLLALTG